MQADLALQRPGPYLARSLISVGYSTYCTPQTRVPPVAPRRPVERCQNRKHCQEEVCEGEGQLSVRGSLTTAPSPPSSATADLPRTAFACPSVFCCAPDTLEPGTGQAVPSSRCSACLLVPEPRFFWSARTRASRWRPHSADADGHKLTGLGPTPTSSRADSSLVVTAFRPTAVVLAFSKPALRLPLLTAATATVWRRLRRPRSSHPRALLVLRHLATRYGGPSTRASRQVHVVEHPWRYVGCCCRASAKIWAATGGWCLEASSLAELLILCSCDSHLWVRCVSDSHFGGVAFACGDQPAHAMEPVTIPSLGPCASLPIFASSTSSPRSHLCARLQRVLMASLPPPLTP